MTAQVWTPIFRTSLIATAWSLAVASVAAALLTVSALGGAVVLVIVLMDAASLAKILMRGSLLVVPVTLVVLPALALAFRRSPRLLRWMSLLAGPLAGGWLARILAAWWLDEARSLDGLLIALGVVGGLTAGIVFARRLPRDVTGLGLARVIV